MCVTHCTHKHLHLCLFTAEQLQYIITFSRSTVEAVLRLVQSNPEHDASVPRLDREQWLVFPFVPWFHPHDTSHRHGEWPSSISCLPFQSQCPLCLPHEASEIALFGITALSSFRFRLVARFPRLRLCSFSA